MEKKLLIKCLFFLVLFASNLIAQRSYESLLQELQKMDGNLFYKYEKGEIIINYTQAGQSIKMVIKDLVLSENPKIVVGVLASPVTVLNSNYSLSKSFLYSLAKINFEIFPGTLIYSENHNMVFYFCYFWRDNLTSKDLSNCIKFSASIIPYAINKINEILSSEKR